MKKIASVFCAAMVVVSASAQLRFGHEYNETDFNNPLTTVEKIRTAWRGDEGTLCIKSDSAALDWTKAGVTIALEDGVPDSLTCRITHSLAATGNLGFYMEESEDGVNFERTYDWGRPICSGCDALPIKARLRSTTRYIKLMYSSNFYGKYINIKVSGVPEAASFTYNPADLDFGLMDAGDADSLQQVTVAWDGAICSMDLLNNRNNIFSVSPASLSGTTGIQVVDVVCHATKQGVYHAILQLTLSNKGKSIVRQIGLRAIIKGHQTIMWEAYPDDTIHVTVDSVLIRPTSTSGLAVEYLSNNYQVIGTGALLGTWGDDMVEKHVEGIATIAVRQEGNKIWYPANKIWKTFVVHSNAPVYDTVSYTVCDNEPILIGDTLCNPQTDTVVNIKTKTYYGADSLIHASFHVNPSYLFTTDTAITYGDTFIWHGHDYTGVDAGNYSDTVPFTSICGCDSIFVLSLVINPAQQEIVWNLSEENNMVCYEQLTVVATAPSGEVVLSLNDPDNHLSLEGNELTAKTRGDASIIAKTTDNKNYLPAQREALIHVLDIPSDELEIGADAQEKRTVLREGRIYYIVHGKTYSAIGQLAE